jgi:gliding motility-associated-like protein
MRNLYTLFFISVFSICAKAQGVPTATIVQASTIHCTDVSSTFSASTANNPSSYSWAIAPVRGLVAYSDLNSPTLSVTFSNTTTYTVFLTVSNNAGTTVSYTTVTVNRSAKASFNATFADAGFPNELALTNYSGHSLKNYWIFNDSAIPDSSVNTVKSYTASGSYMVKLVAIGSKGCNDTSAYAFRISDSSSVVLPNVFSPNGDDVNDAYRPITRGIRVLNAWVYNRYGIIITSWDKVRGAWDGHTTSGEECSAGEYVIIVEALGFDNKEYKLKSTITLVR